MTLLAKAKSGRNSLMYYLEYKMEKDTYPIFKSYIPCLRWKMGEYQAVLQLSDNAKENITPIIEVPEIGFDFENWRPTKTIDEQLENFTKRIHDKWGQSICMVDFRLINQNERLSSGEHPINYIFNELREKNIQAIPVVRIADNIENKEAIAKELEIDGRGVSIRLPITTLAQSDLDNLITSLVAILKITIEEINLIIDFESPNYEPIDNFTQLIISLILRSPYFDRWNSITILGSSFPSSMAEVSIGLNILPRNEWILYQSVFDHFSNVRNIKFGDYAINHPDLIQMDMRKIKPSASVRYSLERDWLIGKGVNVRDNGYEQYRELCRQIIQSHNYAGENFSAGDKYIYDCANGDVPTSNLTKWRTVGTNHHIERVVSDLSSFGA